MNESRHIFQKNKNEGFYDAENAQNPVHNNINGIKCGEGQLEIEKVTIDHCEIGVLSKPPASKTNHTNSNITINTSSVLSNCATSGFRHETAESKFDFTLNDSTIENCGDENVPSSCGGAFYAINSITGINNYSTATFNSARINNCSAENGGAIYAENNMIINLYYATEITDCNNGAYLTNSDISIFQNVFKIRDGSKIIGKNDGTSTYGICYTSNTVTVSLRNVADGTISNFIDSELTH